MRLVAKYHFHFRLILGTTNDNFFKKIKKKQFGANLGPFYPNLGKINFPGKGAISFFNIPIIYDGAKNQKKLKTHS